MGDRVRHLKFGEGTVTNIVQGGRDFEVTVDFDALILKDAAFDLTDIINKILTTKSNI